MSIAPSPTLENQPENSREVREFKSKHWQNRAVSERYVANQEKRRVRLYDELSNALYAHFCPPKARVLEVGAGPGSTSLYLARLGHSVVASDISQAQLAALDQARGGLDIEIRVGDAYNLPARDGEFDVVLSRQFLCHFADWPTLIGEMKRCCRPGGRILTDFASKEHTRAAASGLSTEDFSQYPDAKSPGLFYAEITHDEWVACCERLGLSMLAHLPVSFFRGNHLFSKSLGKEKFQRWEEEFEEWLGAPEVVQFILWFERTIALRLPLELGYEHFVALECP